jgi:hypothetical protein
MIRLLAIALVCCPSVLQAETTVYTIRAQFESKLTASLIDDYENPAYLTLVDDAYMSSVLNETKYTATGWGSHTIIMFGPGNQGYCAGCNGSYRLDFTSTSLSGSNGVDAFGFDYFNVHSQYPYTAFVTFGDSSTQNYPLPYASYLPALSAFFGLISDREIATVHLGFADGETAREGGFGHDNLTIGRIPEPSAILLAAGLVLVIACRHHPGR